MPLKIRNKNAILELLKGDIAFERIVIVDDLKPDDAMKEIISVAKEKNVSVEKSPRKKMEKGRSGRSTEAVIGIISHSKDWSLEELMDDLASKGQNPFFLLVNRVEYSNNIGIIARTAFAAGVNGLIFQGEKDDFFNEETIHFSLGAIARIPLVKMSIFEAIKNLQKDGVKTIAIQMDGKKYFNENLCGPIAFVLGAEKKGISDNVSDRCDQKISIPMNQGIDSINVGVSAGIILYEKVRQENIKGLPR